MVEDIWEPDPKRPGYNHFLMSVCSYCGETFIQLSDGYEASDECRKHEIIEHSDQHTEISVKDNSILLEEKEEGDFKNTSEINFKGTFIEISGTDFGGYDSCMIGVSGEQARLIGQKLIEWADKIKSLREP
jgi:hypothetical protein